MRILSIVSVWFLGSTAGPSTYFELSATLLIGFKETILRIFYSPDMIVFFELVMPKNSIQRDSRKFTMGIRFRIRRDRRHVLDGIHSSDSIQIKGSCRI